MPEPAKEMFLGWQLEEGAERPMQLRRVHRDGPAERARLQAGDELLALDGRRLRRPEDLAEAFGSPAGGTDEPGAAAAADRELLYCRDGRVRTTRLNPDPPAVARWRLVDEPLPENAQARTNRQRWLSLQP